MVFGISLVPKECAHWLFRGRCISLFSLLLDLFLFDWLRGRFGFCVKREINDENVWFTLIQHFLNIPSLSDDRDWHLKWVITYFWEQTLTSLPSWLSPYQLLSSLSCSPSSVPFCRPCRYASNTNSVLQKNYFVIFFKLYLNVKCPSIL